MDSACTNHTPQHCRDSYFFSKYGIDVYICKIHGFPNQPTSRPPEQPADNRGGFREHTNHPRQQHQQATTRDSYNTLPHKRIPTSTTIRIPPIRNPNFRPVHSHPQQGQGTKDKDSTHKQEIPQPYILYIKEYMILRNGLFYLRKLSRTYTRAVLSTIKHKECRLRNPP